MKNFKSILKNTYLIAGLLLIIVGAIRIVTIITSPTNPPINTIIPMDVDTVLNSNADTSILEDSTIVDTTDTSTTSLKSISDNAFPAPATPFGTIACDAPGRTGARSTVNHFNTT